MTEDARWISVTAEGEASVTPDMALVSFAVSGNGKELAVSVDLDADRKTVDEPGRPMLYGTTPTFLEALKNFMYWENYDVRVRMDGKIDRVVLEDILKSASGER